jgi:hypothetical protein
MKKLLFFTLLLSGSLLLAQDAAPSDNQQRSNNSAGPITVRGCISRINGDYVLMKENPSDTFELQATGKTRLKNYLGQHVEVTGNQEPTLSTSSDAMARQGSAAPVTIAVKSIKTIDKECSEQTVSR